MMLMFLSKFGGQLLKRDCQKCHQRHSNLEKRKSTSAHGDRKKIEKKKKLRFLLCLSHAGSQTQRERESVCKCVMVWVVKHQLMRGKRTWIWGGALLCWLCLMLVTPQIPLSPKHHPFADMRNFLGNQTLLPLHYM